MDIEAIRISVADLPSIPLGKIAEDHEIWEGNDGGAHFKITRQPMPIINRDFLALSVSGEPADRQKIIDDFVVALGEPTDRSVVPEVAKHIDMVAWLVSS